VLAGAQADLSAAPAVWPATLKLFCGWFGTEACISLALAWLKICGWLRIQTHGEQHAVAFR